MKQYLKLISSFLMVCLIGQPILAAELVIKDIEKNDFAYEQISNAVSQGYLKLYEGNKFLPNQSLTRKEAAILIEQLEYRDSEQLNLSKVEMQELLNLSKNFKAYLIDHETKFNRVNDSITKLDNEQKILNADINQSNEDLKKELDKTKQELKDTQFYTMIAGGILGILILVKK